MAEYVRCRGAPCDTTLYFAKPSYEPVNPGGEPPNGGFVNTPRSFKVRARPCAAGPPLHKERRMTQLELRRKLRAIPTGGLFFRLLTCF